MGSYADQVQQSWRVVAGVVTIDYRLPSVHVANQSLNYRVGPEPQSRLTVGYIIFGAVL
jgi:hypothetical protein